jgi:hypothetical protein
VKRLLFIVVIVAMFIPLPVHAADMCYDWHGFPSCLPTVEIFFHIPPAVTKGWAVFYEPGVMESTAQFRGFPLDPQPPYIGYVATMSPAMIGWDIWLKRDGGNWEGPYLSVDCPRRNDQLALIEYKQETIEIDFKTAIRWGFVKVTGLDDASHYTYSVIKGGEANVQVSYVKPSSWMPDAVVYRNWYESIFKAGIVQEYIVEDIPANPRRWCITSSQSCEGKWHYYIQPGNDRLTR